MTDQARARDLNEAARRFAKTLADSYRIVYAQASGAGERQQERAREFSELVADNLREQAEASRTGAEQLSEQAHGQRKAGQELARESVEAYADFLDEAAIRLQLIAHDRGRCGRFAEHARWGIQESVLNSATKS